MQYIDKKLTMPETVQAWIDAENPQKWNELSLYNKVHYKTLREQLRREQKGLCCYCCQILEEKVTIEHLKPRNPHKDLTFKYENLLLSCKPNPKIGEPKQCDKAKDNNELDLTPLMKECDVEIKLNLSGELEWTTDRAKHAIHLLNLNNQELSYRRKQIINTLKQYDDDDLELMLLSLSSSLDDTKILQANLYHYILNKLIEI